MNLYLQTYAGIQRHKYNKVDENKFWKLEWEHLKYWKMYLKRLEIRNAWNLKFYKEYLHIFAEWVICLALVVLYSASFSLHLFTPETVSPTPNWSTPHFLHSPWSLPLLPPAMTFSYDLFAWLLSDLFKYTNGFYDLLALLILLGSGLNLFLVQINAPRKHWLIVPNCMYLNSYFVFNLPTCNMILKTHLQYEGYQLIQKFAYKYISTLPIATIMIILINSKVSAFFFPSYFLTMTCSRCQSSI